MKAGREGLLPKWVDLNGNPTFGQGGGTAPEVVELEVPSGSTSGTLTQEQLTKLQSNRETAIKFDGELYYLNDDKTSEGYLVYSHTGQDNTQNFFIKCITVTLSTLGWVLTSTQVGRGSGEKKYLHNLSYGYNHTSSHGVVSFSASIITNDPSPINSNAKFIAALYDNGYISDNRALPINVQSFFTVNIANRLDISHYYSAWASSRTASWANVNVVYRISTFSIVDNAINITETTQTLGSTTLAIRSTIHDFVKEL